MACARRVFDFMEEQEEKEDAKEKEILEKADGNVELKEVSFSYQPDKELLKNLNLNLKSQTEKYHCRTTGCGKTTLINLLMRFYDIDSGKMVVSGRDVKDITKDSLRAKLWNGSLKHG